jgi:hypothetical protein
MENREDWQQLRDDLIEQAGKLECKLAYAIDNLKPLAPAELLDELLTVKTGLHTMGEKLKGNIEGPSGYGLQPKKVR